MKRITLLLLVFIFILGFLFLTGFGKQDFYSTNAIKGTEVFEQEDDHYLVYFYMPECSHCKDFKPILEEYTKKDDALKIYKIDVSTSSERQTWYTYQLETTPMLFEIKKDKGKNVEIQRLMGVQAIENIPTK